MKLWYRSYWCFFIRMGQSTGFVRRHLLLSSLNKVLCWWLVFVRVFSSCQPFCCYLLPFPPHYCMALALNQVLPRWLHPFPGGTIHFFVLGNIRFAFLIFKTLLWSQIYGHSWLRVVYSKTICHNFISGLLTEVYWGCQHHNPSSSNSKNILEFCIIHW